MTELTTQHSCPVADSGTPPAADPAPGSRRRSPPGPSRAEMAATLICTRSVLRMLEQTTRRYGDVFQLPVGGGMTLLNDPELIGPWLLDPSHRYEKGESHAVMAAAVGENVAVVDGERWLRTRKALNPAFGAQSIGRLAPVIAGSITETMARWEQLAQTREPVDLHEELTVMTMRTFLRTMLSSSIPEQEIPRMIRLLSLQSRYIIGLIMTFWLPGRVPSPGQRRGAPATDEIRARIMRVIAERRANPTGAPDILNRLLAIRHEDTGEPLSDTQIRDELNGFLVAGFDTTAAALTWSLALLATNPDAFEKLRIEADGYSGAFDTGADAESMPYARAAFSEAQRMQGFYGVFFTAREDDEIGGFHIPAGTQVGWSDYLLGRNPRLWDHPDRFDPDRFLGDRLRCQHRYQALPFGGGRHLCIGFRLSLLQAQFALTMIARRFHIQPEPGFRLRHRAGVSIGLVGGLPATLRPRP